MDAEDEFTRQDGAERRLWARQPGESDQAFEAFGVYRELGPSRSTQQVARVLSKSAPLIRRWSARWAWVERASAWDDEADRLRCERDLIERQEARARMLDAHAKGGATLHDVGSRVLDRFDLSNPETADEARVRIEKLTPLEAARLMEIGARMERLARDDPNRRITDPEAIAFVEGLVDLTLSYLPPERHLAFLADVEAKFGVGQGG